MQRPVTAPSVAPRCKKLRIFGCSLPDRQCESVDDDDDAGGGDGDDDGGGDDNNNIERLACRLNDGYLVIMAKPIYASKL